MTLQNYYWYFIGALSPETCDEIIKHGNSHPGKTAMTGTQADKIDKNENLTKQDMLDLKKKRDSSIVWLSDQWIYDEIHPYINIANKNAGWNYDWDYSESCQFTKYKLNQYYDWHCDSWDKPYKEDSYPHRRGKIRKLSVTVLLSDPKDYKGGEFQFQFRNEDDANIIHEVKQLTKRGSIIVFPSWVWHRVQPVTEGVRYSMVVWNLGVPFK